MFLPNPKLFDPASIPEETRAFNERVIERLTNGPDVWSLPTETVRQARREGKSIFPLEPFADDAETIEIETPAGPLSLRIIRPDNGKTSGTFLHIHGGGWMYGAADLQDQRLKELANATSLACVSVDYRLTPEHPYPAANEDCEAAALWLAKQASSHDLDTSFLAIGGESAGGHLSVDALLRLRDRHGLTPFHAAVLIAGIYDVGMTPSAYNFHDRLILAHPDMVNYAAGYLQNDEDYKSPEVSPLYARLNDMPPAHFTVGTRDALLDDTLFMANRWIQVQPDTELEIHPGGCHVFQYFDELAQARESRKSMAAFLNRIRSGK